MESCRQQIMLAEQAPELQAEAAILIEASSGTILYEKNATQKMYPVSMTKNADRSGGVGLFQAGGF